SRNPAYSQEYTQGLHFDYISPYFFEIMRGINTFFPENIYMGITDPRIPYYFYNQLAPGESAENPTAYKNGEFVSIYTFSFNIDPNEGFDQSSSQTVLGLYPIGGRFDNGQGGDANFNGVGDTPQRILTYYQLKYIQAELALTGVIAGNARGFFEEGIRASFDKVNEVADEANAPVISESSIDNYVSDVLAEYDAGNNSRKLEHIITQKWIANFGYGIDSYTDYRRTGYPALYDGNTDNLNVTVRGRSYPLSFPWVTANLDINPNAPRQKDVTAYRVFWDIN
ncbi:MAG TPA: SusD/RagB family nutrient-binding outer membrane lipoprotein, partial [Cyclobacteriaceae bacterium]|nr:SusD/RagB family nutrient-binding outer membrane lipoprotein [Cyclobacteriaceae bacterium]